MRCICWLMVLLLAAAPALAAPAPLAALYSQVVGGEEEVVVPPKGALAIMAAEKGVKWTVVARENHLQKPYKLTKGMVLKMNTTHIVPHDINNGFVINLPELLLYHFMNGAYQRRYSLAVGKPSWPTPTGSFKIVEKRRNPTWNVPDSIQEEMEEQGLEVLEKVPPGPKNPLGQYFMATSASGVGIHATNRPWSVGYYVSHGCMRMLPQEIEKLFPQVPIGTPVKIIYRPLKMAVTADGHVWLEAHPNIYQIKMEAMTEIKDLARKHRLEDRIDWARVPPILKSKDGIAHDITRGRGAPEQAATPGLRGKESRLSPLQGKGAKIE